MNLLDYGLTPNVWRPALVPERRFGDDYGIGADQRLGEVTTTTLRDYAFPRDLPGPWSLVASSFTPVTTPFGGSATALSFLLRPPLPQGTEWFGECYARGAVLGQPYGSSLLFGFRRLDGSRAVVAGAGIVPLDTVTSSEIWFGLHVTYPCDRAGRAQMVVGAALAFSRSGAFAGDYPRVIGAGSGRPTGDGVTAWDGPEPVFGTLVGDRSPFDAVVAANPNDSPTSLPKAIELVGNTQGSITIHWAKLWRRDLRG